jgi:hypothetical protein
MNKGFFDGQDLDDLDKKIAEHMTRPTLVKKLKDKKKEKRTLDTMEFFSDVERYWYVYVFLLVSAVFTGTLGIYMGHSPRLDTTNNMIVFQTDGAHVMLAIIYCLSFVTVTEAAFAIMKWLYFSREENNDTQKYVAMLGMIVAGASILGTGAAGGMVIASNISFLTDYVEIPESAQRWVIIAIPVLITTYTFLVTAYSLSSEAAASERLTREQARENDLDHRTRIKSIEQIGMQQLQVAEIKRYQSLVLEGKITAADAQAAIRAKRTLGEEEKRQARDIDGMNGIGNEKDFTKPPRS